MTVRTVRLSSSTVCIDQDSRQSESDSLLSANYHQPWILSLKERLDGFLKGLFFETVGCCTTFKEVAASSVNDLDLNLHCFFMAIFATGTGFELGMEITTTDVATEVKAKGVGVGARAGVATKVKAKGVGARAGVATEVKAKGIGARADLPKTLSAEVGWGCSVVDDMNRKRQETEAKS